jgi:hypothetical protein
VVLLAVEGRVVQHPTQVTTSDACFMAGRSCGESLLGTVVTVAAVKKWLRVSQTTVSLVHSRALSYGRPA